MKAQEKEYLNVSAGILIMIAYTFTLVVVMHNVFRYLCPLRINRPLITLFYVFVTIELLAMIASPIYSAIDGPTIDEYLYSPLWYIILVNYFAENMVDSVMIMQWFHLATSI